HERVEMAALADHFRLRWSMIVVTQHSEFFPLRRCQRSRRKDRAGVRVASGLACPDCTPGFQILHGIDDPSPDLSVDGAGAVGPVLFESAQRYAEEARSLLRAK